MSTLIAGDLHIGDPKSAHREFYKFLKRKDNEDIDSIIINGDLFDLWVTNVDNVLQEGAYLLKYLDERFDSRFTYILGNHDRGFDPLRILIDQITDRMTTKIDGKYALITHGHQFEVSTKFIPRVIPWLVGKIESIFNVDMRRCLMSLSDKIRKDPFGYFLEDFKAEMIRWCGTNYKFVVTNHTHKPMIQKLDNGLVYVNSGDWVQHRTAVKITSDNMLLLEYDRDNVWVNSYYPLSKDDDINRA